MPGAKANDHNDFQVAVVGFGPAGAVATSILGSHGLRTLAIDRSRTVYDKPRAIAIDHEIMRLFDNLGVANRVLPFVAPFPPSQHYGAEGQLIRRIDMVPEPYPMGYTPSMVFTQPPVEAALRKHAAFYSSVVIELGTELLSVEQSETGAALHLRRDDGQTRTVTADYVIACDGAASTVRQQLGMVLEDLVFDEPWLVVDVEVHDHALGKLPATAAQYCDPRRPATFIIGPGRHRRWEIMLLPGEDPRAMEQPARVWELLSPWINPEEATLWRAASYRFHALVAKDWRKGRVFLAGDAAHQQPPFIGQGMCQGLRDVSNLVWKLDSVIRGRSVDSLLDTYGAERGLHVRELTKRIKNIGHSICERDPDLARARDARILSEGNGKPPTITRQEIVPPLRAGLIAASGSPANGTLFPQPRVETSEGVQLMDAAFGTGWRLVTDERTGPGIDYRACIIDGTPLRLFRLRTDAAPGHGLESNNTDGFAIRERDGVLARWFDKYHCRAAIVRPDHYVYGVASDNRSFGLLIEELAKCLQ